MSDFPGIESLSNSSENFKVFKSCSFNALPGSSNRLTQIGLFVCDTFSLYNPSELLLLWHTAKLDLNFWHPGPRAVIRSLSHLSRCVVGFCCLSFSSTFPADEGLRQFQQLLSGVGRKKSCSLEVTEQKKTCSPFERKVLQKCLTNSLFRRVASSLERKLD